MSEALLTAKDVSTILRISPKTVHRLVRDCRLACVKVTNRERRFTLEQVEKYIGSHSTHVIDKKTKHEIPSPPKGGEKSKSVGERGSDLLREEIKKLCR